MNADPASAALDACFVLPLDGTPVRVIEPADVDAHEANTNPEENLR